MPIEPAPAHKGWRASLGAICLLALALRLLRLGFQPLWWDEGWSVYFATSDPASLLRLTAVDIHPPLYYLLLHLWIGVMGSSPIALRLLSILVGTATVPLLYRTGRGLLGETGGLLAAALLAVSPFHIYYSQEIRMYGLVTLLGLAALFFALNMGRGESRVGAWLGYVLAATAALYTQYYAAFLLLALNLLALACWIRGRRRWREALAWLSAQAAVAVLYAPWLFYAGQKLLTYVRFKVGAEGDVPQGLWLYLARHLAAFLGGHSEGALARWWWLGLLPLAVLALSLALLLLRRSATTGDGDLSPLPRGLAAPLAIVLVLLAGGFAVNLVFPFSAPRNERQLLLALPAFLLLVAGALRFAWQRRRCAATVPLACLLAVGVASLGFFYTVPRYADDDYRPVAARLSALALPTGPKATRSLQTTGDAVICVHPWQVGYFRAYLPHGPRPALILTPREVLPRERQLWADDAGLMATELDRLSAEHRRVWLPAHQSMGRVLEDQIERYLAGHAYPVLSEWYGQATVLYLFATGEPVAQPITAQFGPWLRLEGAALSPGPEEAGWGVVTVDLNWKASAGLKATGHPEGPYAVGLRLVDGGGRVWAQRDSQPAGGPFAEGPVGETWADRHGLLVPAGTPPADYRVTLRVYRSDNLTVLPVTFEGGSGGEVTLGTVRIARPAVLPPVEALNIGHSLDRDFQGALRLLGFDVLSGSPLLPGQEIEVELFWQALRDPGEDLLPRLQLLDSSGKTVADLTEKPVAGRYPTAWWRVGELVRDPHALPVPAAASPGCYRLALSLIRAADGQPLEYGRGRTAVDLATVDVRGRAHRYEPPAPEHVHLAALGPAVELVGYDLGAGAWSPGSPLPVTLYWHALSTPDRNYSSFVHLLDGKGRIVAQSDGVPGQGELPSLGWLPGEYLADRHTLQLPFDLPDGEYLLGAGLYDPATGQRLGERVALGTVVVTGHP